MNARLENFNLDSKSKAATPAAWGAAAEVPKKLGNWSPSIFNELKLTVVFTPSGAVKSGLLRSTPFIGVPPREEKVSVTGG